MATEPDDTTDSGADAAPAKKPSLMIWALLGLLAAGGGVAVPYLLPGSPAAGSTDAEPPTGPALSVDDVVYVPVEEVIVNLDEGRLNRYLRLRISLQVAKPDEVTIAGLLTQRKAVLKNWLLSHLSDQGMDDIRGAAGQNRLRREIQDQFNTILFPDGYDRIQDVLFEEFNIQ